MYSAQYEKYMNFTPSIKVPSPLSRLSSMDRCGGNGGNRLRGGDDNSSSSSMSHQGSSAEILASSLSNNRGSFISQALQAKRSSAPSSTSSSPARPMDDPKQLHKRELLMLVLLQHLCTQMDPSPATFAKVCSQLVEKGYLSESLDLGNEETLKLRCKEFVLEAEKDLAFHGNNRKDDQGILHSSTASPSPPSNTPGISHSLNISELAQRQRQQQQQQQPLHDVLYPVRVPLYDLLFSEPSRFQMDFQANGFIGKGAFGSVFRAKHKLDGREYALKVVKFSFKKMENLETAYAKVLREVKSLASLDHPNIVRYNQAWFEKWNDTYKPTNPDEEIESIDEDDPEISNDEENEHSNAGAGCDDDIHLSDEENTEDEFFPHQPLSLLSKELAKEEKISQMRKKGGVASAWNPFGNDDDDKGDLENAIPIYPIHPPKAPVPKSAFDIPSPPPNVSYIDMMVRNQALRQNGFNMNGKYHQNGKLGHNKLHQQQDNKALKPLSAAVDALDSLKLISGKEVQTLKSVFSEIFNPRNEVFEMALFIQMQLCGPETLASWLSSPKRASSQLDMVIVYKVMLQLASGISYIHKSGLIHRDMKPSNIFIGEDYHIKIGDFGLAKCFKENGSVTPNDNEKGVTQHKQSPTFASLLSSTASSNTKNVGTFIYASPEQLSGANYDEKVDIFSLGMIFFELLHPFGTLAERADVLGRLHDQLIIPNEMQRVYPLEMDLVQRCLSRKAADRPSALEMLDQLNELALKRGIDARLTVEQANDLLKQKDMVIKQQEEMIQKLQAQLTELKK